MPRGPRLDAPGVLHHVMVRGIERRAIFREDRDRTDFVERAAALATAKAWSVVAWALLPNHAHLLVRTGRQPLAAAMRSLLIGYAGAFNRRHKRHGHLFQNRYKSIVVEEDIAASAATFVFPLPATAPGAHGLAQAWGDEFRHGLLGLAGHVRAWLARGSWREDEEAQVQVIDRAESLCCYKRPPAGEEEAAMDG